MPIPDADLTRLAELASAASPAPWLSFVGPGIGGDDFISVGQDNDEPDMYVTRDLQPASAADLDFIAAARNLVPSLINEVQRSRSARRRELREVRASVLVSVQRALLGHVGPFLLGAAVSWDENAIRGRFFLSKESEEDREGISVAETEVMADFPADVAVSFATAVVSGPRVPLGEDEVWVLLRSDWPNA